WFEFANGMSSLAAGIHSSDQAAGPSRAVARKRGHACSGFHRDLRVDQRRRRAGVDEKSRRVSVQRAFNIEVSIRVESHRDSRKTATGQETREALAHCRA